MICKSGIVFDRRFRAITLITSCRLSFRRQATLPFISVRPQSCTLAPPTQSTGVQPSSNVTNLRWSRSMRYGLTYTMPMQGCALQMYAVPCSVRDPTNGACSHMCCVKFHCFMRSQKCTACCKAAICKVHLQFKL